jgi:hypothetical protein
MTWINEGVYGTYSQGKELWYGGVRTTEVMRDTDEQLKNDRRVLNQKNPGYAGQGGECAENQFSGEGGWIERADDHRRVSPHPQ